MAKIDKETDPKGIDADMFTDKPMPKIPNERRIKKVEAKKVEEKKP
jgi:hypothetical protein